MLCVKDVPCNQTEWIRLIWCLIITEFSVLYHLSFTPAIYRHIPSFTVPVDLIYRCTPKLGDFIYRVIFQNLNRRLRNNEATFSNETCCYGCALSLAFIWSLNELPTPSGSRMVAQKLTESTSSSILKSAR